MVSSWPRLGMRLSRQRKTEGPRLPGRRREHQSASRTLEWPGVAAALACPLLLVWLSPAPTSQKWQRPH
jgi:hypothetical protein